jgi:hypothetical protein
MSGRRLNPEQWSGSMIFLSRIRFRLLGSVHWIRGRDLLRIRILLFSSVPFKKPTKSKGVSEFSCLIFRYCRYIYIIHQSPKITSHQLNVFFLILFFLLIKGFGSVPLLISTDPDSESGGQKLTDLDPGGQNLPDPVHKFSLRRRACLI